MDVRLYVYLRNALRFWSTRHLRKTEHKLTFDDELIDDKLLYNLGLAFDDERIGK